MSDYYIGKLIEPGDEEGLFLAATCLKSLEEGQIDGQGILKKIKQGEYEPHLYGPLFCCLVQGGYWRSLNQRWSYLRDPSGPRAAFQEICSPAMVRRSRQHLLGLMEEASPGLRQLLGTFLVVDFSKLDEEQNVLREFDPNSETFSYNHVPLWLRNLGTLKDLAFESLLHFEGRLSWHELDRKIQASRYRRRLDTIGWTVWDMEDEVGVGTEWGFIKRHDLKLEWSTEQEIASKKAARWRNTVRAGLGGTTPEKMNEMPDLGIFIRSGQIDDFAFEVATGLGNTEDILPFGSILERWRKVSFGSVPGLHDRLNRAFYGYALAHEKGHSRYYRRELEYLEALEDRQGLNLSIPLGKFVAETFADLWAIENPAISDPRLWRDTCLLKILGYIRAAQDLKEMDVSGYSYAASNWLVLQAWSRDDPAAHLRRALNRIQKEARRHPSAEACLEWLKGWFQELADHAVSWAETG